MPAPSPFDRVDVSVELAFGFGPGTTPAPGDWIDVTTYVDLDASSSAIIAATGRAPRAGITPGSVEFTLENLDGRFSPRNTAGPYYGELLNSTQVRIRTTYLGSPLGQWLGFIDSGWPQEFTSRRPVVELTAHDLFGLIAQADAPRSAFDAFVASSSPAASHYFEPGPDGWTDRITGRSHRHTSSLAELAGDPIIDGAELPWGSIDPDGYGFSNHTADRLLPSVEAITVAARIRLPTTTQRAATNAGVVDPIVVICQGETSGLAPFRIAVYEDSVEVIAYTAALARQAFTTVGDAAATLMDGEPHTLVAHAPATTGDLRIWVDGRELELNRSSVSSTYSQVYDSLFLGDGGPMYFGSRPFSGAIDPIVVWRGLSGAQAAAVAVDAHDAAVIAWAGLRLDERVSRLVTALGLGAHLGTLDVSGIVTQQGYRQGEPLELLQTIEDTEQGRLWIDSAGDLRFSARSWAWTYARSTTPRIVFSDDATLLTAGTAEEMLENGTVVVDDPLNIVNVAAVTSANGRQQTVENATSVAKYGRRGAVQLSGLLHPTDRQSRAIAEWLVTAQGEPQVQCRELSFRVEDDLAVLAPFARTVAEGDLVRIRKTSPVGLLDLYAHVIAITHRWTFTGWTVTLKLDATRAGYTWFAWGSSTWAGAAGWAF